MIYAVIFKTFRCKKKKNAFLGLLDWFQFENNNKPLYLKKSE